jgi:hypothetical protein
VSKAVRPEKVVVVVGWLISVAAAYRAVQGWVSGRL